MQNIDWNVLNNVERIKYLQVLQRFVIFSDVNKKKKEEKRKSVYKEFTCVPSTVQNFSLELSTDRGSAAINYS